MIVALGSRSKWLMSFSLSLYSLLHSGYFSLSHSVDCT